jgi:predicted Zn-dependent protease
MNLKKLFIFLAALTVLARGTHADMVSAQKAAQPISTEEEVKIGREVAANVIAQFGLFENEAVHEYVNKVGLTVARGAPRQDVTYRFAVLNTEVVNAFAAPGGFIFVTKGLLQTLQDESQLACVLGHEIGHVTQRHVARELQKSRMADAVIPSYVKASAQKAAYMSQVTNTALQMLWKGYSREDELESDKVGVLYARAAGYDSRSYDEVLALLKARAEQASPDKNLRFLLSTHPKFDDRIQTVSASLAVLPAGGERLQDRFKNTVAPTAPKENKKQ